MIGSNAFQSSGENITLKAIWTKVSISKSMDGEVYEINSVIQSVARSQETWEDYRREFWADEYRVNITKIVIQNHLNSIEGAEKSWDISEADDGSVMAYAVLNEDGSTYTIYIQGDGKIIANSDSSYLFYDFVKLESVEGLEYFDTSNVVNMNMMFCNCRNLVSLNVNFFDTSNVTNMGNVFARCVSLINLDLSGFNTAKVTDMSNMFSGCSNLKKLNVSSFDTRKVINMNSMFSNCSSLTELDLSSFNTANTIQMNTMFDGCSSLIKLDIRNFNVSKVNGTFHMFEYCSNLEVFVKDEDMRSWIQSRLGSSGTAVIVSD